MLPFYTYISTKKLKTWFVHCLVSCLYTMQIVEKMFYVCFLVFVIHVVMFEAKHIANETPVIGKWMPFWTKRKMLTEPQAKIHYANIAITAKLAYYRKSLVYVTRVYLANSIRILMPYMNSFRCIWSMKN